MLSVEVRSIKNCLTKFLIASYDPTIFVSYFHSKMQLEDYAEVSSLKDLKGVSVQPSGTSLVDPLSKNLNPEFPKVVVSPQFLFFSQCENIYHPVQMKTSIPVHINSSRALSQEKALLPIIKAINIIGFSDHKHTFKVKIIKKYI